MNRFWLCFVLSAVGFEGVASAQELVNPSSRQGYYFGGGLRSGAMDVYTSKAGNLGLMNGAGFVLRGGQMANESFGFGLVMAFNGAGNKEWNTGGGGLQMEGQYVLERTIALRLGVGLGGVGIERKDKTLARKDDPTGSAGGLYTLGFSFDWFPWEDPSAPDSGGLAVTFFAEGSIVPADHVFGANVFIGVELNYWTGLQKNRLRLPDAKAY